MKNLFLFFNRIKFFLFFIFLQLIGFYIITKNSSYQQSNVLNSSSQVSGWLFQQKKSVSDYFNLKKNNQILLEQNALLKQESFNNYSIISNNEVLIGDEIYQRQYLYQPATVIQNSVNSSRNMITLNQGKLKGLKPEMGVINAKGIVGFTVNISPRYSTVMSLMNENFRIPVMPKNDSCVGTLIWKKSLGINKIKVKGIPSYFDIERGDTLITQGGSGIFPKGQSIGVITKIEKAVGSNTHEIEAKTMVDFYAVDNVFVVKNNYKEELDSLQLEIDN